MYITDIESIIMFLAVQPRLGSSNLPGTDNNDTSDQSLTKQCIGIQGIQTWLCK